MIYKFSRITFWNFSFCLNGIFYHATLNACKPLVRTLPFRHTNMFYNISCEFFCMVVRPLGLYYYFSLTTYFVILLFLSYLTSYYYMFHTMCLSLSLILPYYTFIKFNYLRYCLGFALKHPKKLLVNF